MAQAAERFYAAVREGKLRHPRDDRLTRHVHNAHRKATDDGRWRFVKENKQSRKHIDALIAAAMCSMLRTRAKLGPHIQMQSIDGSAAISSIEPNARASPT